MARGQIANGEGLAKLAEMVEAQGGDASYVTDPSRFVPAPFAREVRADEDGWVAGMDTERCGIASVALGAGRATKEDSIDYAAGIVLAKKPGDAVRTGDVLATLFASDESRLDEGEKILRESYRFSAEEPEGEPLFYARVSRDGVERLS